MITTQKITVTINSTINTPVEKVWNFWTNPKHIIYWNHASDDWHTPKAENDLRVGGKFLFRMEARDGSNGFDFSGQYTHVILLKQLRYTLSDGRNVLVSFASDGDGTMVTETFETEQTFTLEMQKSGWQAILDNFKKYVEKSDKSEILHFEISINANAEKVYQTMIDEKHYSEWTSEFNPTSHFKGSWEKDARILFLGESMNGGMGGMVSHIKDNIPNRFISLEHLGIVQDGKEIFSGSKVDTWAGALENYTFTELNGKTLLSIDAEADQNFKSYFIETWPRALRKLKEICET
jgi:uncharacterized protein YndB with AHSA1/START domain